MCSSPWMMSNMNLVSLAHIYFTCVVQRAIPGICHYFSPNQKRKIKLLKFSCIFTKICKGFTKFQNLSPDDKKCLHKHCWWCWRGICVKFGPNHCTIYDFKRPTHEQLLVWSSGFVRCIQCRGFFQNQPTESWNQPTEQEIQRQLSSVSVFQCFSGSRTRKSVSSRSFWYNKLFLQLHTCKITTSHILLEFLTYIAFLQFLVPILTLLSAFQKTMLLAIMMLPSDNDNARRKTIQIYLKIGNRVHRKETIQIYLQIGNRVNISAQIGNRVNISAHRNIF